MRILFCRWCHQPFEAKGARRLCSDDCRRKRNRETTMNFNRLHKDRMNEKYRQRHEQLKNQPDYKARRRAAYQKWRKKNALASKIARSYHVPIARAREMISKGELT